MMSETTPVSETPSENQQLKSRLTFLGILATFLVPLVLAIALYARLDVWTPSTYVNHGRLVEPVSPLGYLSLKTVDGDVVDRATIEGRWTMVYLADGVCGIACQSQLFKMRQARLMLGRDVPRVQNLYLALDEDALRSLSLDYSKFLSGQVAEESRASQLNAFSTSRGGHFYLIDPLGNLVLDYDERSTTKGVVKDLKRLLKVSNIG